MAAIVDENNPLDQALPPRADGLNHNLAAYISGKTSKLALLENEKQVGLGEFMTPSIQLPYLFMGLPFSHMVHV